MCIVQHLALHNHLEQNSTHIYLHSMTVRVIDQNKSFVTLSVLFIKIFLLSILSSPFSIKLICQ